MAKMNLPPTTKRTYNSAFAERGRNDVILMEVFPISDGETLKLVFEESNSPHRQGVWLKTDKPLIVAGQSCPSVELWFDTAPREVLVHCATNCGLLYLYNTYDRGQGRMSQAYGSGMIAEQLPNGIRYHCNDYGLETDFTDLVFRIERVSAES